MKIATVTFHWATNYGAVLQAFALQQYLKINGYETEIINYIPFKLKCREIISHVKHINVKWIFKEYRINKFRKYYLTLSKKKYHTSSELTKECHNYDVYICGSDQIWNEWFVLSSEDSPNLSYYLKFVKSEKVRISYATSFGTNKLNSKIIDLVKPELEKFKSIGVRENTGKAIVEKMGLNATLVIDPTLLLERESYEKLICNTKIKEEYQLFSYILHENQIMADNIDKHIFNKYFNKKTDKMYNQEPIGIVDWLYNIKNCRFVSTNSFHGTIFAIIFNKPFIVIPVEGSNMNNRITTLLTSVGLENRIIDSFNENKIDRLMKETIDWERVDIRVKQLRKGSVEFLGKALERSKVDF